jgi:hypothetical protein
VSDIKAHFALLQELERENQEVQDAIEGLMADMERLPPEQRPADQWGASGTLTRRFIELSARQNEIAAEIKLVTAAIASAEPAGQAN